MSELGVCSVGRKRGREGERERESSESMALFMLQPPRAPRTPGGGHPDHLIHGQEHLTRRTAGSSSHLPLAATLGNPSRYLHSTLLLSNREAYAPQVGRVDLARTAEAALAGPPLATCYQRPGRTDGHPGQAQRPSLPPRTAAPAPSPPLGGCLASPGKSREHEGYIGKSWSGIDSSR